MVHFKGKTRKLLSFVLSMLMILSLLPGGVLKPATARADEIPKNETQEEVSYQYPVYNTAGDPASGIKEWNTGTIGGGTEVPDYNEISKGSDKAVTWGKKGETTWYVVSGGTAGKPIEIAGVRVKGNVHLILKDGCSLKVFVGTTEPAGIRVFNTDPTKPDNTLTIYGQLSGTGALNAIGGLAGAGIGGDTGESGSNITINGGKVTAVGDVGGAGIGGGLNGTGSNITINGGKVTATGKHQGAGIGGGSYKSGSNITINGGYVTANGSEGSAGIGGGCQGGNGSNITINGGTVVANGETEKDYTGAGIGGGFQGSGSKITINGGLVTATGGKESAGIGSGSSGSSSDIYAADSVEVRADIAANPRNVISHESSTTDIAEYLKNNQYATTGIPNYLTFTAEEDGSIQLKVSAAVNLEYQIRTSSSVDWPNDWVTKKQGTETELETAKDTGTIALTQGNQIRFRGNNVTTDSNKNFTMTGKIKASGDVTSLTNAYGGDAVPDANCYKMMFSGCESLITAPALPVTMLAKGCCYSMFNGCSKLLVAEKGTHEPCTGDAFFTCPSSLPADAVTEMFSGTGGDFTGTPAAGKTYYSYTTKVTLNQKDPTKAGTVTKVYASKDMALPVLSGEQLPVKENYVFQGYFDTETGGNKYYNADGSISTEKPTWDITDAAKTLYAQWAVDISKATVEAIADSKYSGLAQTPDPEVKYGGSKLTRDTDYTLSYTSNKDAGTATLIVTGIGKYSGTKSVNFNITKRSVTLTSATDSKIYDGTPLTNNTVTVTGDGFAGEEGATYTVTGTQTEIGSSANTFTYTLNAGTKADNYAITTVEGTLTVAEAFFDVEFDLNGKGTDTPQTQKVASGSCASKPKPDPSYSGWSFKYWFRQGTTAAFDFATKIIENIKLIAYWEESPVPPTGDVVVSFMDGSVEKASASVAKGKHAERPKTEVETKSGYVFAGWFEDGLFGTIWNFLTKTITENTKIYGKWIPGDHKVSYDAAPDEDTIVNNGDKVSLPDAEKEGSDFLGWTVEGAANAKIYQKDKIYTVTKDTVFHAVFGKTQMIDGKDVAVGNANQSVTVSTDGTGLVKAVIDEIRENKAAVQVSPEIAKSIRYASLPGYLAKQSGADTLIFEMSVALTKVTVNDETSSKGTTLIYEVHPVAKAVAADGTYTFAIVDNDDIENAITFRVALPSNALKYAYVKHMKDDGTVRDEKYYEVQTKNYTKDADGYEKVEKYVEVSASSFSKFKITFTDTKPDDPKPDPTPTPSGGNSSSSSNAKPVKTGTWGDPVTDGTWIHGSDGKWMYRTNAYFKNTWGFIRNPYAKEGQEKDSWFRFDAEGKMLTGWQFVNNNWYYLNPVSDGTQGRCYLDTTTPDGYKVDKNGAWVK